MTFNFHLLETTGMQTRSAIIDLGQGQGKPLPDLKSVYSVTKVKISIEVNCPSLVSPVAHWASCLLCHLSVQLLGVTHVSVNAPLATRVQHASNHIDYLTLILRFTNSNTSKYMY